ncbi:MAG: saccharopine dehydrogenase NADP-binding domain-containing protein [Bacteroidota bacterium]
MSNGVLVYGAYGYTGRLIVDKLLESGIRPLLSGRNEAKLDEMGKALGLHFDKIDLSEQSALEKLLNQVDLVVHCAGPFIHTAVPMVKACLTTKTHYIDINGEYNVFDLLKGLGDQANRTGIMLLPGAGFDVVPSDCLANKLKEQLPDAEDLILAFTTKGGRLSRGTAKTMVENSDKGHLIRKNGKLEQFPLGRLIRKVDYGGFTQLSVGISWGDISTAYYSTKIPNITVFTGADKKQLKSLKMAHRLRGLLKLGFVKRFLQKKIDKKPPGPSEESRKRSETYLWGKAIKKEKSVECRLKVPNGYDLTASAVLLITQKILHGNFKPGFQTPATAYGKDLIFEIEGCELIP